MRCVASGLFLLAHGLLVLEHIAIGKWEELTDKQGTPMYRNVAGWEHIEKTRAMREKSATTLFPSQH